MHVWPQLLAFAGLTGAALCLYVWTAAPGLTWANHGPDGGELVAAALSNGVPHPPGYPLYILLLQGWLAVGEWWLPEAEPARLGNLFSAVCAAISAGVTVLVAAHVLRRLPQRAVDAVHGSAPSIGRRWPWAVLVGVAWAAAPLPWGQALITEVYGLHMLLVALLGWVVLVKPARPLYLLPVVALSLAHHLTTVLLLPAVLYLAWASSPAGIGFTRASLRALARIGAILLGASVLGALFYFRLPLAAATAPPINWGYPDNWAGFWWVVSAEAYRGYLFNVPVGGIFSRVAQWANTLTVQYTPVGLGAGLVGLAHLDDRAPRLRNFSLLWTVPVSVYSVSYYTRDSEIYLLPVIWLLAVWMAVGLPHCVDWLVAHSPQALRLRKSLLETGLAGLLLAGMLLLIGVRMPTMSLRNDVEAERFLYNVDSVLEPDSIIVSSGDAETFALWYGAWGNGQLLRNGREPILINYSLLQFDWYRRLLSERYPNVPGVDGPFEELLQANSSLRPIFFSEELSAVSEEQLQPVGQIWRYTAQ